MEPLWSNVHCYVKFANKKEFEIVNKYLKTKDDSILFNALSKSEKMSHEMRNSIATILKGCVLIPHYVPVPRRKPNNDRDFWIASEVHRQKKIINHLNDNRNGAGAVAVVARKYHLSDSAVTKIYNRIARRVDLDRSDAWKVNKNILYAKSLGIDVSLLNMIQDFLINEIQSQGIDILSIKGLSSWLKNRNKLAQKNNAE